MQPRQEPQILGGAAMDPKKTAIVLIEYQNDSISEGGTLHQAVKPVMGKTNMLANTIETVVKARKLGATIVYAPIAFTGDYHEFSPTPYGIGLRGNAGAGGAMLALAADHVYARSGVVLNHHYRSMGDVRSKPPERLWLRTSGAKLPCCGRRNRMLPMWPPRLLPS
jgi:hypothetical protein